MKLEAWHAATIEQLVSTLSHDEAVRGLLLFGSHTYATSMVDAWSDIDLLLVVADEALERFHPATAWLESFGQVYAIDSHTLSDSRTLRTFYADGRHIDWVIAGESSFARIDAWTPNPLVYGSRLLYAASERIWQVVARIFPPLPLTLASEAEFERLVANFRFGSMLAVTKAARNELLVALHLSLDLVRDCLLLAMWLRDRSTGSDHHRDGSQGNHYVPVLNASAQPYTREGILTSIAQSAEAFDTLAAQWCSTYQAQRQPILDLVEQARQP